ncbi:testis-expressed protein 52-like [Glandiceps talaboti]
MAFSPSPVKSRTYFEGQRIPMTRHERENLYADKPTKYSAFSPRPIHKLTEKKPPKSWTSIAMNHKLRTSVPESTSVQTSEPYKLWLHAGQRDAPFPPRWDPQYDSNVWRNFGMSRGVKFDTSGKDITELIASMYPIQVPAHSEVGDNNYAKYLAEVPLIHDGKRRNIAISKSELNLQEFQKLKVRSEVRVPPVTEQGEIRPPSKFKRYEHRFVPTPETTTEHLRQMTQTERDIERNVLGTRQKLHYPRIWKLTFKTNNPEYGKVKHEIDERKRGLKIKKPQIILPQPMR